MRYLILAPLLLTGCSLFDGLYTANECALDPGARCLIEYRVESAINNKLDSLGSASRIDYDIACAPTYESPCPDPVFGGNETGDFEVETIKVTP